jgi:hypothetical protein
LCTENPQSCTKEEEENMLRNSDDHGGTALEELLKQRTFTRQVSGISVLSPVLDIHNFWCEQRSVVAQLH